MEQFPGERAEMTVSDRMFLRRHEAAYRKIDPKRWRRAVIRQSANWGMTQTDIASWFGCSRAHVADCVNGRWEARQRIEAARAHVDRCERALAIARGRERAAIERLRARGVELESR